MPFRRRISRGLLLRGKSANDDDHYGLFNSSQGITNGDTRFGDPYWYISKNIDSNANTYIYRVHYSEHLKNNFAYEDRKLRMPDGDGGICDHVGDIDYHIDRRELSDRAFIVASYEGCDNGNGRVAFFGSDDIDNSSETLYPRAVMDISDQQVKDCPWVSVRNDGRIYSSRGGTGDSPRDPYWIYEYTIDWDDIRSERNPAYESRKITLRDSSGETLWLTERQGGDFSSDGQLFFYNAYGADGDGRIWVFDTSNPNDWYLLKKSSVSALPFYFDSDATWGPPIDELEGISYYDMNCVDGYHSGMPRSELHSMVLHNDETDDDELSIHHFTSLFYTWPERGILAPFYLWWDDHGLWDGANLVLQPGTYVEEVTLKGRKVRLIAPNGTSTIKIP